MKKIRILFAAVSLGLALTLPAQTPPTAADLPALTNLVNEAWNTNQFMARAAPPGLAQFNNDLGIIAAGGDFYTNLPFIVSLDITNYPLTILESNTTPRTRIYLNATGGIFQTLEVPAGHTSNGWSQSVYGNPGSWMTSAELSEWYAERDPARQHITLSLISTSDVPAYLAALTNAIGSYNDGGTSTPILILLSNDTLIVRTDASDAARTMYLHAPASVTGFSIYTATDLLLPNPGAWSLAARLPHNNDPLAYNYLTTASNIFFTLGTAQDQDGDLLSDSDEIFLYGTDPHLADTDGDGNNDRTEIFQHGTSATSTDTDGDGVPDSIEIEAGCTSPTSPESFTAFELARILGLNAIKVSVISDFTSIWINDSENDSHGELLDSGLVSLSSGGARTRAPCEIGESGSWGSGTDQYTALESLPSATVSQRVLRVYLDHYDSTPGVSAYGTDVRVDLDGATIIGTPTFADYHDSTLASGPTSVVNTNADYVSWSVDIGYKTNVTAYSDGGWNALEITYEPRLPKLTVSPNPEYVAVNSTAITFTASTTNLHFGGPVWWEVTPKVAGGPTIVGSSNAITRTNETVQLNPGSVPGVYVLTAKPAGIAAMGGAATVTVFKADLDVIHPAGGELAETEEEGDGGLVAIYRDTATPTTQLRLRAIQPASLGGTFTLNYYGTNYTLWLDSARTGSAVSTATTFSTTNDTTIYLKGLSESSTVGAEEITVSWTDASSADHDCAEKVNFTVVEAEFDIYEAIFIPYQWTDVPHPFYLDEIARGDDRSYDSTKTGAFRVAQSVTIIPYQVLYLGGIKSGTSSDMPGTSVNYDEASSIPYPGSPYSTTNRLLAVALAEALNASNTGAPYMTSYAVASTADMHIDAQTRTNAAIIDVNLHGAAADAAIVGSWSIDWDFQISIDGRDPLHPRYKIWGSQDGFPAYELYVQDSNGTIVPMYQWSPPAGRTPLALFPVTNDETLPSGLEDEIP